MDDSGPPADVGASGDGATAAQPPGSASAAGAHPAATPKRRGFISSHKALTALVAIFLVLAASGGGYLWYLNSLVGNIKRVSVPSLHANPAKSGNETQYPLNILLLGADHGAVGQSVAQDLADGKWTPWKHLSDTIMLVHIPADRKTVQVVSIPRDTWTKIDGYPYGNGHGKINAAFSFGGPSLAVKTVEQLTNITIDHVGIIDWVGFKDLTTALGGVRVYIPKTFYDSSQRITWHKGWQTLEGERALQYVRTRHGLANGDFDRIKRQQNFLRETMAQVLSKGTTRNPIQFAKVVKVITSNLTVDDTWDNSEIRSLAWSLRNVSAGDVQFATAPLGRYDTTPDGQSIVRLAPKQSQALFRAVKDDKLQSYFKKYPGAKLPVTKKVN